MLDNGDGLNDKASGWYAGGDRTRGLPYLTGGVPACDRALDTQQTWYPQHWKRRVSFLQSRALHNIRRRDFKAAASDIAAADAAMIEPDPFHLRSQQLNTRFIEAYLLMERGERKSGQDAAIQAWQARPYARQTIDLALAAIGPEGDHQTILTLLKAKGRLDPNRSALPFLYQFESGRFSESLELVDEIVAFQPYTRDDLGLVKVVFNEENQRFIEISFWVDILGRKAYALQVIGRDEDADAVMADLQNRFLKSTPAPMKLPAKPQWSKKVRADTRANINLKINSSIPPRIDQWKQIILARRMVAEGKHHQDGGEPIPNFSVSQLGFANLEFSAAAEGRAAERISPIQLHKYLGIDDHSIESMFSLMLDGENLTRAHPISTLEGEKFKWARCGERIDKNPDLFCHWTADATLANTEEWAILKAATFARKSGISLFSISNRIDIKHSVTYSANYMPTGPIHQGYSTQLSISAGTEGQSTNNCWRCISPTEVEDSLKPIYIRESGTR